MRKALTQLTRGVLISALLIASLSSIAYAGRHVHTQYEDEAGNALHNIVGEGSLTWNGNAAEMVARTIIHRHASPATGAEAGITIAKGGRVVACHHPGIVPEVILLAETRVRVTSDFDGDWVAQGWHLAYWEDWSQPYSQETCRTYCTSNPNRQDSTSAVESLTAHHEQLLAKTSTTHGGWIYCHSLGSAKALKVLGRSHAFSLDVFYNTELLPREVTFGDWFPFALISPDAAKVDFVFPKNRGEVKIVRVSLNSAKDWVIEREHISPTMRLDSFVDEQATEDLR